MKTTVTIDFDIIMAPSINLYNAMIPNANWDNLLNNPHYQLLQADFDHYQKIFQYLIRCCQFLPANKIHFINDHSQIIKYITEPSCLINIDHHHDLAYQEEAKEDFVITKPNCANWAKYLIDTGKLPWGITWYNNNNSEIFTNKALANLVTIYDFKYIDPQTIIVPDQLIICFSSPWMPPYMLPLFHILMDYCNQHYNTHFEIEQD